MPKYRYRGLKDSAGFDVSKNIRFYAGRLGCELVEMNVPPENVHLLVKGKTALQVFQQFPNLKEKPYWGNHFWIKGYSVETTGMDAFVQFLVDSVSCLMNYYFKVGYCVYL